MVEKCENTSPKTDRIKLELKQIKCFIDDLLLLMYSSKCAFYFLSHYDIKFMNIMFSNYDKGRRQKVTYSYLNFTGSILIIGH